MLHRFFKTKLTVYIFVYIYIHVYILYSIKMQQNCVHENFPKSALPGYR